MTLPLGVRIGSQQPRVVTLPQGAIRTSGPDAAELGAACGITLDPWQQSQLNGAMSERVDGSWAAADVGMIVSRQNGKNVNVEVRELFGAVVLGETIIHTSHQFKTTRESYDRLLDMVESHPDVRKTLTGKLASPASGYSMRFRRGGRVIFIARSRTSGRGLTGDLLIFDEAQDLTDDAQGALLPTISARPGAQAWYLGSAPDVGSTVFHRVRRRGRLGVDLRLAYVEHSAEPNCDLDDHDSWAQANPALGIRITEEAIEAERHALSPDRFAQERLSISPDPDEVGGVFPGSAWRDACSPTAAANHAEAIFGLDVSEERSAAAIVAASPGAVIEVVDYRPGVGWVTARCIELAQRYKTAIAVDRQGPAGPFAEELVRAHIDVVELDGRAMQRACGLFFDHVVGGKLRVRTNSDLDRAVGGAARRKQGDTWVWGRKASTYDISPLVAATVGVWALDNRRGGRQPLVAFG
jgi:hypothetical protein